MNAISPQKEFRARLYRFVVKLVKFVGLVPTGSTEEIFKRQLVRSGASIGANYFESLGASSKRDFINYFTHALKSANETKFWLALLRDAYLIHDQLRPQMEELMTEATEIAKILASSILTMKGKRNRIKPKE